MKINKSFLYAPILFSILLFTIISCQPTKVESYLRQGGLAANAGNYQEAITYSQKALQLNSNNAKANYNIGTSYLALGKY